MPDKSRKDRVKRMLAIAQRPCLLKVNSNAYVGPFSNFDAAARYRSQHNLAAIILPLILPTEGPLDLSDAGELQG